LTLYDILQLPPPPAAYIELGRPDGSTSEKGNSYEPGGSEPFGKEASVTTTRRRRRRAYAWWCLVTVFLFSPEPWVSCVVQCT